MVIISDFYITLTRTRSVIARNAAPLHFRCPENHPYDTKLPRCACNDKGVHVTPSAGLPRRAGSDKLGDQ